MEKIYLLFDNLVNRINMPGFIIKEIYCKNSSLDVKPLFAATRGYRLDYSSVEVLKRIYSDLDRITFYKADFVWRGRTVYQKEKDFDISKIIEAFSKRIKTIHVENNYSELYFKLMTIMTYYSFTEPGRPEIYGDYNYISGKENLDFTTRIECVNIIRKEKKCLEIKIECKVAVDEIEFRFEIWALTIEAFFTLNFSNEIIPPHIIIESDNIDLLKNFILKTINYINVSSINELILKLSVFTDSFNGYHTSSEHLGETSIIKLDENTIANYDSLNNKFTFRLEGDFSKFNY